MANTYTYDDFLKALEQSGYGNQFSQADLNLARQNPDAGMSLLSYKTDYANATTDEARALANQGAESVRSSYGGYTGGGDGGSFKLNPMSPNQFSYGEAPTFEDNWADRIDQALNNSMNRGEYSYYGEAPVYESRYDPRIQETLTGILDRGEFSYDPKTDPVYSAYQKQYAREGQRATANAMGEAAAMTGGQLSSWAMTAANQAGDYYASQMADKIPELYQDAYNRYLQEYQMKLSDLNALRGLESDDYAKYQDQLAQFNTDRQFDYGTWLDQQKLAQQDVDTLRALRSDDLDLYKTNLSQYNTNREFDYGQWLDEITDQRTKREDERDWAKTMAEYEDFSKLNSMGVNTEKAELNANLARAMQASEMGDYSQLAALGVDTSNAALMQQLDQAYKQAQISSIYANMPTEEERALANELTRAQIQKYLSGDTSSTGSSAKSGGTAGTEELSDDEFAYFNSLSPTQKLNYAKLAYTNFKDDRFYKALGMNVPVEDDGGDEMVIRSVNDLTGAEGPFAAIREMHKKGDERVNSQDKVKEMVWNIPGYDRDTMDDYLKDLLAELFGGKKENSTGSGSNSTKSGSNGTNVNARNRASIASV
jgi:hypothetical protein